MAFNIGAVVSVQGEAAYQKAMQGIRQSMTYVRAEANNISSAYDKNDKSSESLTARNKSLSAALDLQGKAVDEAKAALERMEKDGVDPTSEAYQKMSANLNNAQAEFNRTSNEIHANEQAMAQLNEQAKAEKLQKFKDALKGVGEVAGKAVVIGFKAAAAAMAAVSAAAIAAGKAAYEAVMSFSDTAGAIDDASKKVGISAKSYQEWTYAAKMGGMEAETLNGAMAKQQKSFTDAVSGSKSAAKAYKDLGIDIKKIGSAGDAFDAAVMALADMEDVTKRNAIANTLFGKSYAELGPLLAEGSAGLKALKGEANALGGVMSNDAVAAGAAFGDMVDSIKIQAAGLKNTLAVGMLPTAQAMGAGIKEFLGLLSSSLKDGLQASDIKTIGSWISQKLVDGLKSVKQYLPEVIGVVSGLLTQTVSVLVATLPTLLPLLMDGAFQLIQGLVAAVTANAQPLAEMAATMATQLVMFILQNLPALIAAAAQIVISIAQGISGNLPTLIPAVVQAVMEIVNALIANVGLLIPAALQIIVALIQGLAAALPQLIQYAPTLVKTICKVLLDNLPLLIKAALEIILAIVKGLIQAIPELVKAVPEIIVAIVSTLGGLASELWDAGKSIVEGIWQGIKNAASWFTSQVKSFFTGIVDSVKNVLGIHSPSTVFAGIGKNMALGLGNGFTDSMKNIAKSMKSSIPGVGATLAGAGGGKLSQTYLGGLNVNIYGGVDKDTATSVGTAAADRLGVLLRWKGVPAW